MKSATAIACLVLVFAACGDEGEGGYPFKVFGTLADADVAAIVDVIESEPASLPLAGYPILWVDAESYAPHVEVWTGYFCGNLCGSGIRYKLEHIDDRWQIVERQRWVS